jgi:hypothetical protein
MIGNSCDSNLWSTRESLIQVTFTIPMSRGELLPFHHVVEGDGVDGIEGATESGSSSVSPPILEVCRSAFCILCFSTTPSQNRPNRVYIVSFRSRWVCGVQDCIEMMVEAKDGPHHMARVVACMVALFWSSWHPLLTPYSHGLLFSKKWCGKKFGSVWRLKGPWKLKTRKSASQC